MNEPTTLTIDLQAPTITYDTLLLTIIEPSCIVVADALYACRPLDLIRSLIDSIEWARAYCDDITRYDGLVSAENNSNAAQKLANGLDLMIQLGWKPLN